jgi:hypothetical protein
VAVGDEQVALNFGDSCFIAAAGEGLVFSPGVPGAELLLCRPTTPA